MTGEGEPLAKFPIIVKFAVKYHTYVVRLIPDWLMAARKIDDTEAAHPESRAGASRIICEYPVLIRAAMHHRRCHRSDARLGYSRRWVRWQNRRCRTRRYLISGEVKKAAVARARFSRKWKREMRSL